MLKDLKGYLFDYRHKDIQRYNSIIHLFSHTYQNTTLTTHQNPINPTKHTISQVTHYTKYTTL